MMRCCKYPDRQTSRTCRQALSDGERARLMRSSVGGGESLHPHYKHCLPAASALRN